MDFYIGLLALIWRAMAFVCFVVLIAVGVALWNVSQGKDRALARSLPTVVSWVLLSLSAGLAWAVLIALLVVTAGGYVKTSGALLLSLLLIGPALYIRVGYRYIQKIKAGVQDS